MPSTRHLKKKFYQKLQVHQDLFSETISYFEKKMSHPDNTLFTIAAPLSSRKQNPVPERISAPLIKQLYRHVNAFCHSSSIRPWIFFPTPRTGLLYSVMEDLYTPTFYHDQAYRVHQELSQTYQKISKDSNAYFEQLKNNILMAPLTNLLQTPTLHDCLILGILDLPTGDSLVLFNAFHGNEKLFALLLRGKTSEYWQIEGRLISRDRGILKWPSIPNDEHIQHFLLTLERIHFELYQETKMHLTTLPLDDELYLVKTDEIFLSQDSKQCSYLALRFSSHTATYIKTNQIEFLTSEQQIVSFLEQLLFNRSISTSQASRSKRL